MAGAFISLILIVLIIELIFDASDAEEDSRPNEIGCDEVSVGGFGAGKSAVRASASSGILVVKGSYMGISGDAANEACLRIVNSEDGLAFVDFRKGIKCDSSDGLRVAPKQYIEVAVKGEYGCEEKWHGSFF